MLRRQVADSTAERQAHYARGADDAAGSDEPERLGRRIEVEPGRSALRVRDPPVCVHVDPAHRGKVDHEPFVQDAVSRRIVTAPTNRDLQLVRTREVESGGHIDGIPSAPRGVPQIEVTFDIDANGIVNVSAKDKATTKTQHITITASSGLSEAEIQRMVKDAQEHEAEDKKRREAIEARNKLEALTFQVQKHLDDNRDKIAEGDKLELETALKEAKEVVEGNRDPKDAAPFEGAFEKLQKASHKMAEALYRSAAGAAGGGETPPSGDGAARRLRRAKTRTTSSTPSTPKARRPRRVAS